MSFKYNKAVEYDKIDKSIVTKSNLVYNLIRLLCVFFVFDTQSNKLKNITSVYFILVDLDEALHSSKSPLM